MLLYSIQICFKGFLMNLVEIKKLIEIFNNNSEIAKLSLKQDNFELKLDKNATITPIQTLSSAPMQPAPQAMPLQATTQTAPLPSPSLESKVDSESSEYITSPMVGTFYHKPSPDASPYVAIGDTIKKGQTIGIIEAMKIMNEIEAEFDCKVIAIETADGQPVEYGSKLISVEKI